MKISLSLFLSFSLSLCALFASFEASSQNGNLRVRSDGFIQIGYSQYNPLSFGSGTNGNWVLEHWNSGFNVSRPWPATNYGNYFLFIKDSNGNVGIGKVPSYKLDVNGDIATYGTLQISSDRRLKTNIQENPSSAFLDPLLSLKTYTFNYYNSFPAVAVLSEEDAAVSEIKARTVEADRRTITETDVNPRQRMGFLAQEVQAIFPQLVVEDEHGFLSVDYLTFIPMLIEALKEQQQEIQSLQNQLLQLENRVRTLERG